MSEKRKAFNNREAVIKTLRQEHGDNCWLCNTAILFWPDRHEELGSVTIDHVLPISLGGTNERDNLRLAHYHCNNVRGNLIDPEDIKTRIDVLFVDGVPSTAKQRREHLIKAMKRYPGKHVHEPLYPFCSYPRLDRFAIWPMVDVAGRVIFSQKKPDYLH